jgi:hypothetical protein
MTIADRLWNAHTWVRSNYIRYLTSYGRKYEGGTCLSYGDRVYLIEEWPGYDCCADQRCTHYRCEHNIHLGPPIYLAPGIDPATVPDHMDWDGCANADCPCERFQEGQLAKPNVWTKLLTFLRPKHT